VIKFNKVELIIQKWTHNVQASIQGKVIYFIIKKYLK